jgi:hypothetical protein
LAVGIRCPELRALPAAARPEVVREATTQVMKTPLFIGLMLACVAAFAVCGIVWATWLARPAHAMPLLNVCWIVRIALPPTSPDKGKSRCGRAAARCGTVLIEAVGIVLYVINVNRSRKPCGLP